MYVFNFISILRKMADIEKNVKFSSEKMATKRFRKKNLNKR